MWESPINVMEIQDSFVGEIKEKTEEMVFTEIKRIGIEVDKEELIKALQYDRQQYEKGYADARTDLDLLISELLVPMQIENVCEDLLNANWRLDEEDETWCSRNCGVTNDGKCPAMNCYKEWIRMKKGGAE